MSDAKSFIGLLKVVWIEVESGPVVSIEAADALEKKGISVDGKMDNMRGILTGIPTSL